MHRIDGLDHVANKFSEGDPMEPREATQVTPDWLNSVQEEIANAITGAGIALAASGAVDTDRNQLLAAIQKLNPVKAACVVVIAGGAPTVLAGSALNVASVSVLTGPNRVRVTFTTPVKTPFIPSITDAWTGGGSSPGTTFRTIPYDVSPNSPNPNSSYVEFLVYGADGTTGVNPGDGSFNRRFAVSVIANG